MKLISLNVGLPREVIWHGKTVTTAIYKEPVTKRLTLRHDNLEGDRQADLTVHGGEFKAVYCYPLAHYEYWRSALDRVLTPGAFGENFTVDSAPEDSVYIGDRFSVGSAEVIVTQPRLPCFKLGIRFGADDMVKRFFRAARTGFYLSVAREGEVGNDDEMSLISRDPNKFPVSEVTRLYGAKTFNDADAASIRSALQVAALPQSWKEHFQERLQALPT